MTTTAHGKRSAALASVGSGLLLTGLKLVVGFLTGSLAILSEAAHSALDLLAAGVTYGVVHVAEQLPDANHPYGHARAEHLGALAETVLLVVTGAWVLWNTGERRREWPRRRLTRHACVVYYPLSTTTASRQRPGRLQEADK